MIESRLNDCSQPVSYTKVKAGCSQKGRSPKNCLPCNTQHTQHTLSQGTNFTTHIKNATEIVKQQMAEHVPQAKLTCRSNTCTRFAYEALAILCTTPPMIEEGTRQLNATTEAKLKMARRPHGVKTAAFLAYCSHPNLQ